MSELFPGIPKIKYEGRIVRDSPLAFKYYDPSKQKDEHALRDGLLAHHVRRRRAIPSAIRHRRAALGWRSPIPMEVAQACACAGSSS